MFADVRSAVTGLVKLWRGEDGYRPYFDVSAQGVVASFRAAILGLPLFILAGYANGQVARSITPPDRDMPTVTLVGTLIFYIMLWGIFPLVARFLTRALDKPEAWAPWLVVHNWTFLVLLGLQAVVAGVGTFGGVFEALWALGGFAVLTFAVFVHWRAATAAFDDFPPLACLGLALGPMVANGVAGSLIRAAFTAN